MTEFNKYEYEVDIRKQLLQKGIPTMLPFRKFPRLMEKLPGIIRGEQMGLTGLSGDGKSRFLKAIIKDFVDFSKGHKIKCKIFLNSLEETPEKIRSSVIASAIYKKYGVQLTYFQINNYGLKWTEENDKIEQMVKSVQDEVNTFFEDFEYCTIANPYGFFLKVVEYLFHNGTFYQDNVAVTSWDIVKQGSKHWNRYIANDPSQFAIAITDTLDALMPESGKSQYETVKDFSKFFSRKLLGMICGVASIFVQQQDSELNRAVVNFKGQTIIDQCKPGLDKLLVCKATQQDYSIAVALFDPIRYGEEHYLDYDLTRLKSDGNFRSLIILKTREGNNLRNAEIPLMCYFGRDEFVELPLPNSKEINNFYQ